MSFICGKVYIEWYRTWYSIAITPKYFSLFVIWYCHERFSSMSSLRYIWLFCVFYGDLTGPGICPGVFIYMAIFSENEFCCICSLFLILFGLTKKNRWIESMYTTSASRRKTKVLKSIRYRKKKNHFSLFPIRRLVDYYVDPLWRLIGNLDALHAANTIPEFRVTRNFW